MTGPTDPTAGDSPPPFPSPSGGEGKQAPPSRELGQELEGAQQRPLPPGGGGTGWGGGRLDASATPDPAADQRRAADPAASVWVAASAGTGKTKVLIDRVLGLMLAETDPRRILCLTFTRAAAAEMSNRIAARLGRWATLPAAALDAELADLLGRVATGPECARARRLFADVVDAPGGMNIQTIHAFCQSLLGRFPLEAGLAPHFAVMDERDAEEMLLTARESVLLAARLGGDDNLARALATVTTHADEKSFGEIMGELARRRAELAALLRRHGDDPERAAASLRAELGLRPGDTAASVTAEACSDAAFEGLLLRSVCQALLAGGKNDRERGAVLAEWLAASAAERPALFDRYAGCFLVAEERRRLRKLRASLVTKPTLAAMPGAADILAAEAERLLAAAQRCRAATCAETTAALLHLGAAMMAAYAEQKRRRALLDYDDLILATRDLLARPDVAPWVLFKLDGGIDHVLIDEAQDTNPVQWEVVERLTGEFFAGRGARDVERTVFAVGDVKQSIFSFQGADPAAFRAMRERYRAVVPAAEREWREVALTVSFRSTPAVLRAVDAVFAADPGRDGVALDGEPIVHTSWRAGDAGLVELWPPVPAAEADTPPPWKPPVEAVPGESPRTRLAGILARRIARMIGNEVLASKGRPVEAGDIMILVRRRDAFVEDLVRLLKQQGVEVAGVDRMVLTDQLAVMDLVALGRFLLLPDDDLTLATVLKGPLIGLDEDQLFRLAHGRAGTLWAALTERTADDPAFAAARDLLAGLLARADFTPPYELFAHVLGPLGGRRRLVGRLGYEAEDPIAEFMDLALGFERHHTASLEGFLHWLEAGEVEVKRDLEHAGRTAVRVMTVHGAKGLQAPIVFLPDTLQVPRGRSRLFWPCGAGGDPFLLWPPSRDWHEAVAEAECGRLDARREQEYRRLLYVAMTRAEDRLYICGWENKNAAPQNCWYNLIRDALAPLAESVEDAGLAADRDAPGGQVLRLVSPQRRDVPLTAAGSPPPAVPPLPDWSGRAPPPEADPPRPLAPSRPDGEEPAVRSPFGADDGARFRRGRLIHRLLQSLPDLPPERRRVAAQTFLARPVHGLDAAAAAAIAAETLAVLDHPEFAALFGSGSRAEVPIVGLVGGRVLSGQVDRLLVAGDAVLIVDFKTNRPPPSRAEDVPSLYLAQLAAYRAALRSIYPGRAVRCLLLWTDGPRLMELPEAALDAHAPVGA